MTWPKDTLTFLKSDYLHMWWLLLALYLLCYGMAWVLATVGQRDTTVQRCRQAWAWAVFIHLITVVALTLVWWQTFGVFRSFFSFLPLYLGLGLIDLVCVTKLFMASRN
jgi:hypothetical protein